jgi:hypothetical protein
MSSLNYKYQPGDLVRLKGKSSWLGTPSIDSCQLKQNDIQTMIVLSCYNVGHEERVELLVFLNDGKVLTGWLWFQELKR